jgi:hypothetical protein
MVDYTRTIDNIRSVLASAGPASKENVWAVAVEYADVCETVNERLRKCGQLLREGLRSEAIQQSEMEPNLLNLVATLDFPEVSAWTALLQVNGLAPPSPLLVDVASDLNEAYTQEQPLATLMRRHRLLALGHNPLRDRIGTLRQLARLDANNPVWQDDLRTYEQARQQEIHRATELEYQQGNLAALTELTHDVQSSDWLDPLPAALVQQVRETHARLMGEQAHAELERLEPQLNDAFSQFDVTRGRVLRERWNASEALSRLSEGDPLYERVAPALEWLDQQDRETADEAGYKTAVADLEQALDNEEGLASLERRAHGIVRYERPIPMVLEQRLRARVASLDLDKSRRVRLIVAGVSAAVILIGSAIAYSIVSHRQEEQVASHASTLQSLIEQRQFDDAKQHLDQLMASAPALAADASIQQLGVELATRMREEQARLASFTSAIEAAEQAGDEEPDRKSLEEARRLAMHDSEKARVLKLETAVAATDRRRQSERNANFVRRLNELKSRIDQLDRNAPDVKALGEIRQALASLVTGSSGVNRPVLEQSKVQQARIQSLYKTTERQQAVDAALAAINVGVGNVDKFKLSLEQFIQEFPESTAAVDFKRAIGEAGLWKDVEVWNRFIDRWQTNDVSRLSATRAKEMLAASKDIVRDHGSHPVAAELLPRIAHLEAIVRRTNESGERLHALLIKLFTDSMVTGLWMIEAVDERGQLTRYYLVDAPPEPSGDPPWTQFKFITDFSRVANKTKRIPARFVKYSGQAPQTIVAKNVMDELAKLDDQTWESAFTKIIEAIHSNERLDPIFKAVFLKQAVDVACQGSESMKSAFAPCKEALGAVEIDPSVRWMDLADEDGRRNRAMAEDLLKRLPALRQATAAAALAFKKFRSPLGPQYEWIGWLVRDKQGWQCRFHNKLAENSKLFVAISDAGEKGLALSEIGQVHAGKAELRPSNALALVQGRPVFAVKADPGPKGTASN